MPGEDADKHGAKGNVELRENIQGEPSTQHTANSNSSETYSIAEPPSAYRILATLLIAAIVAGSLILNISLLSADNSPPTGDISTSAWILIIAFSLIALASTAISFWLYYIRSLYLKDGPALVPERWGLLIAELNKNTTDTHKHSSALLESLISTQHAHTDKADSLMSSFLTLQDALDIRDKEIKRLKDGYDAEIFKRFLHRFIRVDRALQEISNESSGTEQEKNFRYLCRLMEDALEECGVEQYNPDIGSDYRDAGNAVADDPTVIETEDTDSDFTIASIERPGYAMHGVDDINIVIPAKVSIYRLNSVNE